MTLALFVELLYAGLVQGLVIGMTEDATAYELGDVQVFSENYLTKPSLYDVVPDHEHIIEQLEAEGYHATERLFGGGLAASGELSAGALFVGIDPMQDARTMDLHLAMAEGVWLDPTDPHGVVVGRGLARTLALELGDEVVVLSQATDGSIANELFQVRGILMSVAAGMDRSAILMPETTFRELMALPDGAHKIFVRKPVDTDLGDAKASVLAVVGEADGGPRVKTWKEVSPILAQYIESVSSVIVVLYFIVYVAVGILILNAMLMALFERIREFGVLKAIGYGPGQVFSMMLIEGLVQASIATVLGSLLAVPVAWYMTVHGINVGILGGVQMAGMTMPPVWKAHYTLGAVQVPVLMLFFIVVVAVLYPALKAARLSPLDAMHHQ
jgi:ABC-type lipoprotein release transport system permease subunit